ncbi:STM3941 family protein [Sphingobacterium paludis]|uniref:PH (Pleckstrin Homology) domain-containing protein n=1 Tax=Sphingobacterium paludis TaxID=1476465 RepID=A0A4R7CYH3_9SPHI|nr:STM3941 family protein [Sphingobacterium paludis]TDS12174.1 hypothetical protein B0I21_10629 [Sphingobacterium paludis]
MTEQIEIFRDSKKSKKLFIRSIVLCLVLAGMAVYSFGVFDRVIKIKLAVVSCALLLVMLFMLVGALRQLKDKSALVKINAKGISGKTTPLSKAFGEIEWSDVVDMELRKVGGDTLVAFIIQEHPKYERRLSKSFRSMAYQKDSKHYVIMYTASEIETDAETLFDQAIHYWKMYAAG